ncbi:hypothetical protein EIP86_003277 [Pleurotus ostreatoroseus]|nr:hypothetical protein EIP86_003277 [Pleurotus ostreatoroseus]
MPSSFSRMRRFLHTVRYLLLRGENIPFTKPPHSQKRTAKSLERSTAWLADLLRTSDDTSAHRLNVLVQMAGGTDEHARQAFAEGLTETLYGQDLALISPLKTLDEGLCGYVFDLVPLRASLQQEMGNAVTHEEVATRLQSLMALSLRPLPTSKVRIVHSARSPHEMLRLIRDVGVDLFDARWAHQAANLGVALDFCFPVRDPSELQASACRGPIRGPGGKLALGHNLFSPDYAHDHTRFASTFRDTYSASSSGDSSMAICPCSACSPMSPVSCIVHSAVDAQAYPTDASPTPKPPFTRAYVHHLLHTHEMSSHSLLAVHNLTVLDAFFAGVRGLLSQTDGLAALDVEIQKFVATYSDEMAVMEQSHVDWAKVERERGKGRLMREKGGADN